jgi:hypothetical protein
MSLDGFGQFKKSQFLRSMSLMESLHEYQPCWLYIIDGHKIVSSYLITMIRYSLPLIVNNVRYQGFRT